MTMTKYALPAMGSALVVMGCVQLQGSPAMRPHARAAAQATSEAAASPTPDSTLAADVDRNAGADAAPAPAGEAKAASAEARPRVAGESAAPAGSWSPPPAEGWGENEVVGSDLTPSGWLAPLRDLGAHAVVGRFGDPRDGGRRSHEGIDILADRGTPVLAPVDGRVIVSGQRGRAGNVVVLESDQDGRELWFMHLDSREVTRGSRVRAGDRIGTVGNTGNAEGTEPHLHFEVHGPDGPVDPWPLLLR